MNLARTKGGTRPWRVIVIFFLLAAASGGCSCSADSSAERNDLTSMETDRILIGDHAFEVWLAIDFREQQLGLMNVTEDELAPITDQAGQGQPDIQRGMLFTYPGEQRLSFWMRNTIIPLDIAFIRGDGEIVTIYTMAPLETRTYPSIEPAQFALEVRAGLLAELGITVGDHVEIPESVLKRLP